jgi:primosomal protein N' (replication factor Y)
VLRHDYKGFYADEIEKRKEYFYPPFSRIILLTLKHKDRETVTNAVNKLAALLRQDLEPYIVGPVAPVIGRIKNQYLMEIMIKLPKEKLSGNKYRTIINMHINQMLDAKAYRSVRVVKNVDVM